ncbi:MAG TPA: serine hydrolase [Patescibacteria group bacterium]|nr:serine hydrolase [Patescibacteria group bacterium]
MRRHIFLSFTIFFTLSLVLSPLLVRAEFNPNLIISDAELFDKNAMSRDEIQRFLDAKGSYLRTYQAPDPSGITKPAADLIYEAAQAYQINPKYILVTLQKEQSLVTDDNPTPKQLDWATGYAVCDGCSLSDPKVIKYKGFGLQVDNSAGIMRWYYDNSDRSYIKKKDIPIRIDNQEVTPQSWATAFLYTYTPHLHGNKNFWRIWNTWFSQLYPNGSVIKGASSTEIWLLQDGKKRQFKNMSVLMSRIDPKMIITIPESDLSNYPDGTAITFHNYALLQTANTKYLLDYDTLRPFASEEVIRKLGYNPQEFIEVTDADLVGFTVGSQIKEDTVAPEGIIYQLAETNQYFLLKDNVLHPIIDQRVVEVNYNKLKVEKKTKAEIQKYEIAFVPLSFADGTLLKAKNWNQTFVIENGKRRMIADEETFLAMGYKKSNVTTIDFSKLFGIPQGETIYLNSNLLSSKSKFLGDVAGPIDDLFKSKTPIYLVAEYPSGRILSGKNIDRVHAIASITKLLTAYEALDQTVDFKKTTTFSSTKHGSYGNPLKLVNGEKLKNGDIFNAMLVGSINNTAKMIATATGLSEKNFVTEINKQLEAWGTDNTHVEEVTGLSAKNVSTARDLLKIFSKVLANKTIKNALFQTDVTFKDVLDKNKVITHKVKNTNLLINKTGRNYRILASKTGYIDESGANLLMLVESKKDKKQYVIVTLGDSNYTKRFNEPHALAEWSVSGKAALAAAKK